MKQLHRLILIFILLMQAFPMGAQQEVKYDDSEIKLQEIPEAKLEELRNSSELNYDEDAVVSTSFWNIIWRYVSKFLSGISANKSLMWGIYIALLLGSIYLIYNSLNVKPQAFFDSSSGTNIAHQLVLQDIHKMKLDELIRIAIINQEYRRAVRFLYLKLLKKLDSKQLIVWEINKTNRDYYYELTDKKFQQSFTHLSYWYDYLWYGNFPVGEDKFQEIETQFKTFEEEIKIR